MNMCSLRLLGACVSVCGLLGCGDSSRSGQPTATAPPEWTRGGKVILSSPSLTAGLPGTGPLTVEQLKPWLDDPRNHQPLDFALPVGMTDAQTLAFVPQDNPLTRAKIELGRQMFFDNRLSGLGVGQDFNGGFSCAECHQPDQGYAAWLVMPEVGRNAPVAFNRLFSRAQFWDGKAASLEEQPLTPINNVFEMNASKQKCVEAVRAVPEYRLQFETIFGEVSFENVCKAVACFERALVTGASPWDYRRRIQELEKRSPQTLSLAEEQLLEELRAGAKRHPMSAAAIRGEAIFFGDRGGCFRCHTGPNLTDEAYHNVFPGSGLEILDTGRHRQTGRAEDHNAFKTPTLRNLANTAPYMHDGGFDRLEEVIEWFDSGGDEDDEIEPLGLSRQEKNDLLAFLHALKSPLPQVQTERLPQ